jgi:hypothetical protein
MTAECRTALCLAFSVICSALQGCAVARYPDSWPAIRPEQLLGDCPHISGRYSNSGVAEPTDGGQPRLADFFFAGLAARDSDEVRISQTSDKIDVALHSGGQIVRSFTFTKSWLRREDGFRCHFVIPTGLQDLSFHAQQGRTTPDGRIRSTDYRKAADGSLIVRASFSASNVALVMPHVWYRFSPVGKVDKMLGTRYTWDSGEKCVQGR